MREGEVTFMTERGLLSNQELRFLQQGFVFKCIKQGYFGMPIRPEPPHTNLNVPKTSHRPGSSYTKTSVNSDFFSKKRRSCNSKI